jgi:hypothetical protein
LAALIHLQQLTILFSLVAAVVVTMSAAVVALVDIERQLAKAVAVAARLKVRYR